MRANARVAGVAAALSVAALALAACSSGGGSAGSSTTSTPAGSSSAAASNAAASSSTVAASSSSQSSAAAGSSQASSAAGSSAGSSAATSSAATASLASVCPSTVKIQINWTPEAEQGAYYQLAASGGSINAEQKNYTAPLIDPTTGKDTGVKVELIAGGPAVGYTAVEKLLYTDPSILLGMDATDSRIESFGQSPTMGVVSPMYLYDNVFFWDPAKYHFTSIADIGKSGATILSYGSKGAATLYLEAKGDIKASQVDGSYNGSPAHFVASGGAVVSGGYATYEPYYYSHELTAWNKPISYIMLQAAGYNPYSEDTFVTPANLTKYSACLKQLVPMLQRAQIAYLQSPTRVNQLIVNLDAAYKIGGTYTASVAAYTAKTLLQDKIVANPPSGGFGSYDMARVNTLIKQLQDTKSATGLPSGFSATSLETNQFIDPSISLDFYKGPFSDPNGVITEK